MKKNQLLYFLAGIISFTACTTLSVDQPSIEVLSPEAATPTPAAKPTATTTPSTPDADDQVWLKMDELLVYSHSNNLCMKDGDTDPVFLMAADACEYAYQLFDNAETIILLGWDADPTYGCKSALSYSTRIWRVDRQTGETTYLTSTYDAAEKLGVESLPPLWSFQQVPGSDAYVFDTAEVIYGVEHSEDLYLVDKNGQLTILFEPGSGGVKYVLSPDGQHIAYVARDDNDIDPDRPYWIGLIDANGANHRTKLITYDWIATGSEWTVITRPVWREDSDGFWIAIPPPMRPEEGLPNIMTTWYVPVNGEPVQIGSFERPLDLISAATFSPDGSSVAYVANFEGALHITQPDGSGDHVYFEGEVHEFGSWVDNTHFIFWTNNLKKTYMGGIGEEPILLDNQNEEPVPVPEEGCAPYGETK